MHDFGCLPQHSDSGSCIMHFCKLPVKLALTKYFISHLLGYSGLQLELLQMFQSTSKEGEAKLMLSPLRFFSVCWRPSSL